MRPGKAGSAAFWTCKDGAPQGAVFFADHLDNSPVIHWFNA